MSQTPEATDLVSVITPCFNAVNFIAATIESVRAQTYPTIEHIVIDDGSTDGSHEIVEAYGDSVRFVRLEQNRGGSAARNTGAALARGEFLMFLDADDVLGPDAISALVAATRDVPDGIAFCEWRRLKKRDGVWQAFDTEVPLPAPGADHLRGWMESSAWVPPCAVLWRRDVYARTGGWDERVTLNDDGDLIMGALISGARLVQAKGGVAYYRNHGDERISVSCDWFSEAKLRSQQRVLDKLVMRLRAHGKLNDYNVSLARMYHQLAFMGYTEGFKNFARECEQRVNDFDAPPISRTAAGRLLIKVIGLERKEQLVLWLARWGVASAQRREFLGVRSRLRQLHRDLAAGVRKP